MPRRARFVVRGQVQGVGFRPFVFTLAEACALTGFVRNSPRGVVIEVQGREQDLDRFARDLETRLPPLARITALDREDVPALAAPEAEREFSIAASSAGQSHAVLISPDICTCPDCLADTARPGDRRFGYAFTNCTNCGPRYTITRSIPYDRATTSMACFELCPDCREEYENPRDRRFHAQPNACPVCGPQVWFVSRISDERQPAFPEGGCPSGPEAIAALAAVLARGGIAAIKGLGGFHLACNARDDAAVAELRRRKHRPHKPFAVMAPDLESMRRIAALSADEEALLTSMERPIVLCRLKNADRPLSALVSPDTGLVGLMLPYTPLHYLLLEEYRREQERRGSPGPAALVMTSGNPGGEPICLGNREALAGLGAMADAFLFHNRDILIRVDDSVLRHLPGQGRLFYRRARGFVPRPTGLNAEAAPSAGTAGTDAQDRASVCVLGAGAELKNTLCLTKGGDAFVSQHIGDMANLETAAFHGEIRDHLADLLRVEPQLVVRDLHPDYLSSRMAEDLAKERDLPLASLQHHAAHAFAVLAEHRFRGKALVLALDGTGLGNDGRLWGGEALLADTGADGQGPSYRRLAHLAPLDLPGGERAIREPWRIAHALLLRLGLVDERTSLPWLPEQAAAAGLIPAMLERGLNTPVSTSCGRLFDAVSALLGLCNATSYEGQAAIRLEEAQGQDAPWQWQPDKLYACPLREAADTGCRMPDSRVLFAEMYGDMLAGTPVSLLALRFHHSLAVALADLAATLAGELGLEYVGLSGGCLQNATLHLLLVRHLAGRGLKVLSHRELPPGDGCISLGQAFWGSLQRYLLPK